MERGSHGPARAGSGGGRVLAAALFLVVAATACTGPRDGAAPPTDPPRPERESPMWPEPEPGPRALDPAEVRPPTPPEAICPTDLPSVTVEALAVAGGVVHVFTGAPDQAADIQLRARRMAEIYARHARGAVARRARDNPGDPMDHLGVAPAWPRVENHRRGADLFLLAADPAEAEALLAHELWHAERMNLGECPLVRLLLLIDAHFDSAPDDPEAAPVPFDGEPP
jgi:hypothetical protein